MNVNQLNANQLSGVPETLLMTLYYRALETQRADAIIRDQPAVAMMQKIDYNFTKFDDAAIQSAVAVRTKLFDAVVHNFFAAAPDSLIVTLGAGLCTRALRLDNGQAQWISIDLPPVEPFWHQLIGTSERNHFITCSVTDFVWIDRAQEMRQNRPVLFIAEGLFMYLSEAEVKNVTLTIQKHFPTAQLVMEVLGQFSVKNTQLNRPVASTGAKFDWGANDCRDIEAWGQGIKLLNQWYYTDYCRNRQFLLFLFSYLIGGKGQLGKVGHFQLD